MSAAATMVPNMRRSKLSSKEAALLAGEVKKPSWESRNEGIHERVSFEDSIWGFDLAGGAYYNTPLRVTAVKNDSRAQKAGIRPGDKLLRINDIDTSTLTIQEAHEIIIESGIHIRLAVSAPDDTEDSYNCWQDQVEEGYDSEEERRKEAEKAKKRIIHCRTNANWSLQWPWVSKRRIIYKESNCFMVPSKYENKHRDKFPVEALGLKAPEDIVLHSKTSDTPTTENKEIIFPNGSQTNESTQINENGIESTLNNEVENKIDEPQKVISNGDGNEISNEQTESQIDEKTNDLKSELQDNSDFENDIESEVSADNDSTKNQYGNNATQNIDEHENIVENGMDENAQDQILNEVLNGDRDTVEENDQDAILDDVLNETAENPQNREDVDGR